MYSGDYDLITTNDMEAQYVIGIASDEPLPPFKASLFNGEAVLKKQIADLRELITETVRTDVTREIKSSRTYKIGDAIVKRLRGVKKLFNA